MAKLLLDEYPLIVIPSLAKAVGINGAIILQQLHYWLLKSTNLEDGFVWRYRTYDGWAEDLPWLSAAGVRKILKKLEKDGHIITGNYNRLSLDKTIWYRIDYNSPIFKGQSMCYKVSDHVIQSSSPSDTECATIPETTPEITAKNTKTNIEKEIPLKDSLTWDNIFDEFWQIYPRHTGKKNAYKSWLKISPNLKDKILEGAKLYAKSVKGKDPQYTKMPATWLNGECWDDEIIIEIEEDEYALPPEAASKTRDDASRMMIKYREIQCEKHGGPCDLDHPDVSEKEREWFYSEKARLGL